MRIGVCLKPEQVWMARELEFDYVEGTFDKLVACDEEAYRRWRADVQKSGLAMEAFKGAFRPDACFYGETVKLDPIGDYLRIGMQRAQELGTKILVIGSGKARAIPEGIPTETAKRQFARILTYCAEIGDRYGIRVVVEPLGRTETNFIHTVEQGEELRQMSGHPGVGDLVDFFHYYRNGDTPDGIALAGKHLIHTHLSRPNPDRLAPRPEDAPILAEWAKALACAPGGTCYPERISIESLWTENPYEDLKVARPLMEVFKSIPVYTPSV